MPTILWLDLGNSRLKYWLTQHNTIIHQGAELHLQSPVDLLLGLANQFLIQKPQQVHIASVMDQPVNARIAHILAPLQCPIHFVNVQSHYLGLTAGYQEVATLGIDRWLQVLALAGQHENYCIVGCGTALTLDLLQHNTHLGGYILAGPYLQRDALTQGTRRVKVTEQPFNSLMPGQSTQTAVHHGILLSLVGAIEKLMRLYPDYKLILTGGDAALFLPFIDITYQARIIENLLFQGLQRYFGHSALPQHGD